MIYTLEKEHSVLKEKINNIITNIETQKEWIYLTSEFYLIYIIYLIRNLIIFIKFYCFLSIISNLI